MRYVILVALFSVALVGDPADSAPPVDLKGKTLKQAFDELLPNLSRNDAQQRWQSICNQVGAPGNEALRAEACKLMADKLGPPTPNPARIWLLKQLERIGRGECVDAVALVLDEKDDLVHDAALRCLANNPAPQCTARLTAKLPTTRGKAKVGLLNALGHRRDAGAVEAVGKELTVTETPAVVAAAHALGRIGTPEASRALRAARSKAQGEARLAISDAWLLCADRRLTERKIAEALAIYKELARPEEPRAIRLAALRGTLRAAGEQAGPLVVEILAGSDTDARAIVINQIDSLPAATLKPLAGNLEKLPAASQVLVLNALAARRDRSQLPVVLAALKNKDLDVRRAVMLALGRLGNASVVDQLVQTVFAGGSLAGAASESLGQLSAEGVDEKLIAVLEGENLPNRVATLIGVLERRRATAAVPAILKAAQSREGAVRGSAFAALRTLAEPKHVPEMVVAFLRTEKGKEREQAELAIVAVCGQIPEPERRAGPVLAVLKDRGLAQKPALLPLLGRLGGQQALREVTNALNASDPDLHAAGLVALCNWPDPSVTDDLLKLARGAKESGQRLMALQAAIRVNCKVSPAPPEPRLAALKKAMELATRVEERKEILEKLGPVRHVETLRFAVRYLDDKDLAQSACKGIVELAHSRPLREPNQAEFNKALDRVIATCKDRGLIDRAKQYKRVP